MTDMIWHVAKFRCGKIVTTPNARERLTPADISLGIGRHIAGEWGEGDTEANERALIKKTRLWSVYRAENGTKFSIITEADRLTTTVLLPTEY